METPTVTPLAGPTTVQPPKITPPGTANSPVPAVPVVPFIRRSLHPNLASQCKALFFRQSFINDYLKCPQMALYRWVLALDQSPPFLAATLGTAGHEVIYGIHQAHKFDYTYTEILELLEKAFHAQIVKEAIFPKFPEGCDTPDQAFALRGPEVAKLVYGYQYHNRNRQFHSTFREQSFVLQVPGQQIDGLGPPQPYLFTGQIDQGGYYDDGTFAIRDIKFRDNNFRPYKTEINLNVQLTIYAAAVKYGVPACQTCRPAHYFDPILKTSELTYHGPCATCKAKIGTPLWPQKFPGICELIWMRDFDTHKKDQYERMIIDRDSPKIPNPKTGGKGQKVYPRKVNPDWESGYKTGDFVGPGFIPTYRPPSTLNVLMSDVLRICDEIRKATFYRIPGDTCDSFCSHKQSCLKGLELEIQEVNLSQIDAIGTEDPW